MKVADDERILTIGSSGEKQIVISKSAKTNLVCLAK